MAVSLSSSPFFGRRVVASAFVLAAFGWGVGFYGPPVYLATVVARTGWSVALVSAAVTWHFLLGALVVANLPAAYRRFGVPRVTIAGGLALAAGVLGWALAAEPWQLFAAAALSGAGWVALGAAAVNAVIAPWFVRGRPAALSLSYNGASLGGVVFSPLWVLLIEGLGFARAALLVGAVLVLTVWLLARFVFSVTPAALGQAPDGASGALAAARPPGSGAQRLSGTALWRDRRFATLAAGMALGLFAQIGLIAHLLSLLLPVLGAQGAGLAMGLATACAVAGRWLAVRLASPATDRRLIACAGYGVQVAGSLLLLGVVLFGLGIGNATSLPPLIAQAEFPEAEVQRVVSLIVALAQASYAFAPAAFGLLRALDPAGGATALFAAAALVQLAAIGCFLLGRRRPGRRTAPANADGS